MKIAVVTNLYPPINRGGAGVVAQRIVGELVRRGHSVVVISTMPMEAGATSPEVRESLGETVYRFFPLNIYHTLRDFRYPYFVRLVWHLIDLFSESSAKRVESILRVEKPEIVLTHNLKGIGLRVPSVFKKLGLPWIHTVHDVQLSVPSGLLIYGHKLNWFERIFRRPYEWAVKKMMDEPDLVISPSKFLADFYFERGFFRKTKVVVIPNPVPTLHVSPRGERMPGPLRFLFIGQLERHKGTLELLEAINLLEIPFELHIASEGTLAPLVKERSKNDPRVIYHGFVSIKSLEQLFNIVDAVVVPSKCYENSPTIIYESLQSGLPVIASDIGGVGELIHDGKNGYLVEPGSGPALAETLRKFATDVDFFRKHQEEIRASVAAYSLGSYVDGLEKIMVGMVKK